MKRKWLSRALATALATVMAAGMMVGCGNEKTPVSSTTETQKEEVQATETQKVEVENDELTYPLDTDMELSFYIAYDLLKKTDRYASFNEVPFYSGLSEKTGIQIDWQAPVAGADQTAAYNLLLQEEVLPNIIYGKYDSTTVNQLYEDGVIYDLTEYLPKYAPDFWAYYNDPAHEADKNAITNLDGKFLYMPSTRESEMGIAYLGPVIRQDWLDECGLKAPVTLEEWENVLRTFKDKYGAYLSFELKRMNNGGALASGVGAHAGLDARYYVEDGKVLLGNAQPEWKELLTVLNRWYEEGLIDPDFTTTKDEDVRARALNNQTGVVVTAMSQLTNFIADAEAENTGAKWVGFEYPRTAAGEPTVFIQTESTLVKTLGGCVVTTSSTEEELIAALKFLNYGYSEEGMVYWNFGEEGESYEKTADGSYQLTELITADERGINTALMDYSGVPAAGGPAIILDAFTEVKNNQASIDAVSAWTANSVAADYLLPPFSKTSDEQAQIADISSVITTYVAEMAVKFVTGEESLDNFDKYLEQLDAYRLPELLELQQTAYDRYMNR